MSRYVPICFWNFDGKTEVKFAFTYPTKKEAIEHGISCQNKYGDMTFSGKVKKIKYVS